MLTKAKIQKLLQIKPNSGLIAIITNASWLFADRIFRMGVGLFIGVWVARYLGVQQYGLFNYANTFVTLFSPLTTLGLDNIVIRNLVCDLSKSKQVLGTTFLLKLLGGVVSLLLTVFSIYIFHQDNNLNIWLVAILATTGIFHAFDTIDLWFQSQVQSKYTVVAKNTAFIIIALAKVALIKLQTPLIAFAWITLAEIGLNAISLVVAYKMQGYSLGLWRWSFSIAKSLLQQSWFMMLSDLSILIYMGIDKIMLGKMVGNDSVGIYSVASRISEIWYFIPMGIISSVSPAIFAAKKTNEALYYKRLKQLIILMGLLSLFISVPVTFFSEHIITMLFSSSYIAAGKVLAIHIWSSFFIFISVAISPWFIAEELPHLSFYRTVAGGIINIILNLILIPKYAEIGAATATLISYAFTAFPPRAMMKNIFLR